MVNYLRLQAQERQDLKCSSSSGSREPSPLVGFGQAALPHTSSGSADTFCVNGREVLWERGLTLGKAMLLLLLPRIILSSSALRAEQNFSV